MTPIEEKRSKNW